MATSATGTIAAQTTNLPSPSIRGRASAKFDELRAAMLAIMFFIRQAAEADDPMAAAQENTHVMAQMGAKRIGSLAIGIGVVGIVLNTMSNLDVVSNSTGVINVTSIFDTAGSGLELLVIGVIIAAAAVLLSLWSGF